MKTPTTLFWLTWGYAVVLAISFITMSELRNECTEELEQVKLLSAISEKV